MGGSAGHMRHPFDLNQVTNGTDLITLFERLPYYINARNENVTLKVDGLNMSVKYHPFTGEFALDRGSQKLIDVQGVVYKRLVERFGEGHGMVSAGRKILSIFNDAKKEISPEIHTLGLQGNPWYFLNIEFIEGRTNAIDYNQNLIVIHDVRGFYSVDKKGVNIRPGLQNITGVKAKSVIVEGSDTKRHKDALTSLVAKLNAHMIRNNLNFKVYSKIPVCFNKEINYENILNKPHRFKYVNEDVIPETLKRMQGKPVGDWLRWIEPKPANYTGTVYDSFIYRKGKKISPYHKMSYCDVIEDGQPVDEGMFLYNIVGFMQGILMLHATRLLGKELLRCLTSPIGEVSNHEGIVIDGMDTYQFKITGEFIVSGMFGRISEIVEGAK